MGSDSNAFCKEDPVQKAPDFDERLLAEIDPVTVEISGEDFKGLLGGDDIPDDVADQVHDFSGVNFSELDKKTEDVRYEPLCDSFNSIVDVSSYEGGFKVTATHMETKETDFRCDLALFPDHAPAEEAYLRDIKSDDPRVARCAWAWMVLPIEVKCKDEDAAYGFGVAHADSKGRSKVPLLRQTPKGKEARAQFVKYVSEIMMRQHRTHAYGIYIAGANARFARFDRAGCVVSAPVHLQDNFVLFRDILYRLLNLSPGDQGFDTTVFLACDRELRILRANPPKKNSYLKKYYQDYLNADKRLYPIYKVKCPAVQIKDSPGITPVDGRNNPIPPPEREYLIGKPSSAYPSPTGRCTRGYVAFDIKAKRFVFLKDQWRAVTRRSELDTYRRLHQYDIPYIATPIAGGDIDSQRTRNHVFMSHRDPKRRPVERVHCRLVTKEVGRSLETYQGSFYLFRYLTAAIAAHMDAWQEAGVLHHDVSAGNIMIDIERDVGFLNDWDLAKWKEELEGGVDAREPAGVSGTWPYKSALALQYPYKPAEVADDIESFIYVILYMAMRFHRHNFSALLPKGASLEQQKLANATNETLAARFYDIFYRTDIVDGVYTGGYWKASCIGNAMVPIELEEDANGKPTPFARVLQKCYHLMKQHYRRVPKQELAQYAVKSKSKRWSEDPTTPRGDSANGHGVDAAKASEIIMFQDSRLELDLRKANYRQHRSPLTSSSDASSRRSGHALRPMDDHVRLLDIVATAFYDEDGKPMAVNPYMNDKFYDQCLNQLVMTSSRRKNFSGVALANDLARISGRGCVTDSRGGSSYAGSEGSLPAIAEAPEEEDAGHDDRASSPAPLARTARARKQRKTTAAKNAQRPKKTTVARKDSPPRKAQAAKQAKVARKAAAVEKATASRKPKAAAKAKAAPAAKAPARSKAATAGKATKTAKTAGAKTAGAKTTADKPAKAAAGAVRRSARLAPEEIDAPPAPATGKRKRAANVEEPSPEFPAGRTRKAAGKPLPTTKTPAASKAAAPQKAKAAPAAQAPPARRSSRLAAKA